MLGLFILLICYLIGLCAYNLIFYLLKKLRGEKSTNKTISIIVAIIIGLGFGQWFIGYCH